MRSSGLPKTAETLPAGVEPSAGMEAGWTREAGRVSPLSDVGPTALSRGVAVAICTLRRPESVRRILRSLEGQTRRPEEVVVVDASSDDLTERAVGEEAADLNVPRVVYVRVRSSGAGLTRQRNRALALAGRDLIAFFDDDVVLEAGCLAELERVHRETEGTAGVGAMLRETPRERPPAIWRVRRILGIVPNLAPGRYHRSGMSTPWGLAGTERGVLSGDWLPGFAMMWKTDLARELGFYEAFAGYAQAEDLEFSLRAGRRGRLLMACEARVRDDHALAGRPNAFRMGYMAVHNRWIVHRRCLPGRTRRDAAWFAYAWIVDTLLLGRHLVFPSRWGATVRQIAGRLKATLDLAQGR